MPPTTHIAPRKAKLFSCLLLIPILVSCGVLSPLPVPTATATVSPTVTATATIPPTATPAPTATPTQIPILCGGPSTMFILLVGSDARSDSYKVGLSDSMRVVRLDFTVPSVQILTFPRDLYVEIPGISDHYNITHGKLNQAFLYGNPGYNYYDGPGRGAGLLALTLDKNFGVQADHYVAVNIKTFVRIVDELGGIDIDLPYTIDGRVKRSKDPNRYFPAGKQHLNGYRTMLLARMRPGGDIQRIETQNLVLQAVAEKLLSPSSLLELPRLIQTFRESVQTDLGPAEFAQLLCLRTKLDQQNILYGNFPATLFKNGRVNDPVLGNTSILEADFNVLRQYVNRFNQGDWPRKHADPPGLLDP
jgi:LCP family protein required for cell wall assembly